MANQKFDSHASPIAILKQRWRRQLKKICQELPLKRQQEASAQAHLQLSRKCQKARFVLSFASFGAEINLWPFNEELATSGRLVLPLIVEKKLCLFQVTHFSQLEPHRWGMLEPKISNCNPIDISLVEIALIPGLGFDLQTKYRLGYGHGYYDRLLACNLFSTQTWGIGFLEQAVENLPYSNDDVALDQINLF